ncbi:hypothetical protein BN424_99 [Carnobacterium maltaromaticum LMA28]|uniref:Uncharacterized protein n=1 Tax=Carnobacterium maltaromaticum LMA28 TaxID=1234679 RepID=K8E1C4_CARML|nr:hypothetical protein [Carnobacterium maltaromaticum]CCO09582.2 hypothetical protein BN424_99 [Carnobacterium maltaromaticum LMA28]
MQNKYEEFIKKLVSGLNNEDMSKLINNKRIAVTGFPKVTSKNRTFILKMLLQKKNIDTIYELMISKSIFSGKEKISLDDREKLWDIFNRYLAEGSLYEDEAISLFLIDIYQSFGIEEAKEFYYEKEEELEQIKKVFDEVDTNELEFLKASKKLVSLEKEIDEIKYREKQYKKTIKKYESEKKLWIAERKKNNEKFENVNTQLIIQIEKNNEIMSNYESTEKIKKTLEIELRSLNSNVEMLEKILIEKNAVIDKELEIKKNSEHTIKLLSNEIKNIVTTEQEKEKTEYENRILIVGDPKNSTFYENNLFFIFESEELVTLKEEISVNKYKEIWMLEYVLSRPFIKKLKKTEFGIEKKLFNSFLEIMKEIEN